MAALAGALADFCIAPPADTITADVLRHAQTAILDLLGCAIAGSIERAPTIVGHVIAAEEATPRSTVINSGVRTSPTLAALANGTAAHVLDFDDIGNEPGSGHPGVCVIPAALALAEAERASGRDLLTAVALGYEVMTRFGLASGGAAGDAFQRGFHGSAVLGVFGATAASIYLLGLNRDQAINAFGIAASRSSGLRANFGTMTKAFQVGEANRAGLFAAILASRGFTASPVALDGRHGWGRAVAGAPALERQLTRGLGKEPLAINSGINAKLYPSCAATHGPVHLLRSLLRERGPTAEVSRVRASVPSRILRGSLIYDWPADGNQARFSLRYCLAVVLVYDRLTLADFTAERINEVARVRDQIAIIEIDDGTAAPITVDVDFAGGPSVCGTYPDFTPIRATQDQLYEKFRANLSIPGWSERSPHLIDAIETLVLAGDVARLTRLLAKDDPKAQDR